MSLNYALLVSLIQMPKSGYDLAKQFDGSVGFFWQATHQQIYRELTKLEQQGSIAAETIVQEGRPAKKVFSVTAAGINQLVDWVSQPSEMAPVKDEFLLKVYAGYLLPTATVLEKIHHHRQMHAERLQVYREIENQFAASPENCCPAARYAYLTLLRGINFEQSWLDWCDQAIALIKDWEIVGRC